MPVLFKLTVYFFLNRMKKTRVKRNETKLGRNDSELGRIETTLSWGETTVIRSNKHVEWKIHEYKMKNAKKILKDYHGDGDANPPIKPIKMKLQYYIVGNVVIHISKSKGVAEMTNKTNKIKKKGGLSKVTSFTIPFFLYFICFVRHFRHSF